jgi:hypothetical protein
MIPVRRIACCGRFAARGRNTARDSSALVTQHRGSLDDSGTLQAFCRRPVRIRNCHVTTDIPNNRAAAQWEILIAAFPITHCGHGTASIGS